jgi:hypothetical protein
MVINAAQFMATPLLTIFYRLTYPLWHGLADSVRNDGE